jgi:putative spermidine/putrescine transport system substrate-binding protein
MTAGLLLGETLTGCGQSSQNLSVQLLKGSVPPQLVAAFGRPDAHRSGSYPLNFKPVSQIAETFKQLQLWQSAPPVQPSFWPFGREGIADLVTLGDAWLASAIQQELLAPLDSQLWQGWDQLPEQWHQLVQRNSQGFPDPAGKIWAAPYRWGTTVIAYRADRFKTLGWEPTDWPDLWRSDIQGKISLPDQPREVIGLTLKRLGRSYNTADPEAVTDLQEHLAQLQQQVKLYSSTDYLQPLLLEDTWLAVGWSMDLLPLLTYDRHLKIIVPQSGTALWADLWVRPRKASADHVAAVNDWINFCWQPRIAVKFAQLGSGTSPLKPDRLDRQEIEAIQHRDVLMPEAAVLAKSEFIEPLDQQVLDRYQKLWQEMRRSGAKPN